MNLTRLAEKIERNIKNDFERIHITRNLIDTIKVRIFEGKVEIEIPAERYDFKKWNKDKVVVYNNTGSYAQAVDFYGGFSKTHKIYVENAIYDALVEQMQEEGMKGVITSE